MNASNGDSARKACFLLFHRSSCLYLPYNLRKFLFHLRILDIINMLFCEENYIISGKRAFNILTQRPHTPFCAVAPNRISLLFPCYKSNTTELAVLTFVL